MYGQNCICGQPNDCRRVSTAFALLQDPRRGYVLLPSYTAIPSNDEERDTNDQRAAYLRCFADNNKTTDYWKKRHFVALHHFHPTVVLKHLQTKKKNASPIPRIVSTVDLKRHGIHWEQEDRVVCDSSNGGRRKGDMVYFTPTYRLAQAKDDLKKLILMSREEKATTTSFSTGLV